MNNYTLNEKKIINSIYKHEIDQSSSYYEEALHKGTENEVKENLKCLENLISNGIVIKNGDRLSISNDKIGELIISGQLDIGKIIWELASNRDELMHDLHSTKTEIDKLSSNLEKATDRVVELEKLMTLRNLELDKQLDSTRKSLNNNTIKMVEILGVFISLFTIISININFLDILTTVDGIVGKIAFLLTINVTLLVSIFAILKLIRDYILNKD